MFFCHLHSAVWYNQIHSEWVRSECMQRQPFIKWRLLKKIKIRSGVPVVGIPFAQSVQEASGVTQKRVLLELLQKSKYKTKRTYPGCSLHASPKNLPHALRNCRTSPLRNPYNTREAHTHWNHRVWQPTLNGTPETEEFTALQSITEADRTGKTHCL